MLTSLKEEEQQPFEPVEPAAEAVAEIQTELPEEFDADFDERIGATAL
jgi:nanoRNase/pAp phosphatase (c-di-AMP/oligoRNAs hydrolase)